jgi:hypothetical protein
MLFDDLFNGTSVGELGLVDVHSYADIINNNGGVLGVSCRDK